LEKRINFTVANHGRKRDATGYIHYDDIEFSDVPDIATSGFNYCACKLANEYRLDDNFDGSVDVLIIDVDETCTMEDAKIIFKEYEYYIITTKSHQKDKGGIICDRFRIFIPLNETVHIREKMEEIYSRFISIYDFIDTSCRNVSRFFYSSPSDAIVIHHEGRKYNTKLSSISSDDIMNIKSEIEMPENIETMTTWIGVLTQDTYVFDELLEQYVNGFGQILIGGATDGEVSEDAKLKGIDKYLDEEYYQGNKSNCLFKTASMMKRDGCFTDDFIADYLINFWQSKASRGDKLRDAKQNILNGIKRGA